MITVINKWDRPGLDPLALMDEIYRDIGLQPTPLTWPVGIAGDFKGVLERRTGDYVAYTRTAGGARRAPEERLDAEAAAEREGADWETAVEESDLLAADGADHDQEMFLDGITTPVLFASAILNFGVAHSWRRWSTSRRRRCRSPTSRGSGATSASRSAPSCSRCRRAWTPTTATGSRSRASPPASSSAAWW